MKNIGKTCDDVFSFWFFPYQFINFLIEYFIFVFISLWKMEDSDFDIGN